MHTCTNTQLYFNMNSKTIATDLAHFTLKKVLKDEEHMRNDQNDSVSSTT